MLFLFSDTGGGHRTAAEAVMQDPETGLRTAASDPRGEGAALGQP